MTIGDIIGILVVSGIVVVMIAILMSFFVLNKQLAELHLSLNSRLDKLLETTKLLARAEGYQAGQDSRVDRDV